MALFAKAGLVLVRRPISDFYVAGRLVPALFNGMAAAIALIAVLAFPALAGLLGQGWDGLSLLLAAGGGATLFSALLIAPYLRKFGGYTVPDFIGERFAGTGASQVAMLAVILCSFPALALVLSGLGALSALVFEVNRQIGLAIGVGLILLCSIAAGMRSASLTQIVQYAVLLAVSAVALAVILFQGHPLVPVLGAGLEKAVSALALDSFAASDSVNRFAGLFCLLTGVASLPHLLLRSVVTPSIADARTSFLWALPFTAALIILAARYVPFLSAAGNFSANDSTVNFALTVTGAIATLLAAGTGLALAVANSLSYDFYYRELHTTASTAQRMLVARGCLVLVAALAALAALNAPDLVLRLTGASFSLAASTFLPVLLLGIWWKRATPEGALAGMLAGLIVCLYYMIAPHYMPFAFYETSSFFSDATPDAAARYAALRQNYYLATNETARQAALIAWEHTARAVANWGGVKGDFAALFAVPVGFLTMIGVSLFTPAPSRDVQNFVEDLRKPSLA